MRKLERASNRIRNRNDEGEVKRKRMKGLNVGYISCLSEN